MSKYVLIQFLIFTSIHQISSAQTTIHNNTSKEDFKKLIEYMTKDGGIWITPNPKYDSTQQNSVIEIEMHLVYDEERQFIKDDVTLRFKKLDYLSWISIWAYHPGKQEITYTSYGPEGRLISGKTEFVNDSTFVTVDKLYEPDGSFKELKDENIIISENVHKNISYEKKNGTWEEIGTYVWKRKIK
ncbi:MAG: hypothetical protein IPJ74_18620 [Saprospiraceae bacterium]|nr:hypothetical protein [Saprospiraceae bacterium]